MSDESDKLEAIQRYLDELTSPGTLEFESAETRRVANFIAGKVHSIITGEKFPPERLVSEKEKAILEAFKRMMDGRNSA